MDESANSRLCDLPRQCIELSYDGGIKLSICPYLVIEDGEYKLGEVTSNNYHWETSSTYRGSMWCAKDVEKSNILASICNTFTDISDLH